MSASARLRIGISRCLLGDEVRWDGGHKYEPALFRLLGPQVEWVSVCPEVEAGLPIPREPMRLESPDRPGDAPRLMLIRSRQDFGAPLANWAAHKLPALIDQGLDGFVLKKNSPSCGPRVSVFDVTGTPVAEAAGAWAAALIANFPGLPIEDEERLREASVRDEFLARVRRRSAERHRG